jgi:hypothetical protein
MRENGLHDEPVHRHWLVLTSPASKQAGVLPLPPPWDGNLGLLSSETFPWLGLGIWQNSPLRLRGQYLSILEKGEAIVSLSELETMCGDPLSAARRTEAVLELITRHYVRLQLRELVRD